MEVWLPAMATDFPLSSGRYNSVCSAPVLMPSFFIVPAETEAEAGGLQEVSQQLSEVYTTANNNSLDMALVCNKYSQLPFCLFRNGHVPSPEDSTY